ncbi:serine/threonine-protein kinase [Amycolatopsis nigrescens]|uniref:serine/threonine-protein kinase n=1 Tax=Amycolatopsis nigrescens TaxID=381445 RepID=UPI00036B3E72|nr:serine/threonine-protein kinase [Amycolatopsis nigrescens]
MTEEQAQYAQQTQPTQPAAGPRVIAGRYVLLGEIGRGGMGIVWRAEDKVIGRHVAIKELREAEGVFQERVLREVRTGGRLNDPAVVTVYDVVSEQDTSTDGTARTYIVMELVEAPTLSDLVRQHGPLPAEQVASIGEQVLSALQAAHEAGIVHRDVKPGNIMVAPNGRVKLTDFGIAHAVDDPRLTTSGMIVGSPAFMAPERVEGREAMPASDLWSLGVTLFFAVEGVVAFERTSTAATLHAIMTEVPYLTRGQGPLASAIMGLLISSPEARISPAQARGLLTMARSPSGQQTPPGGQRTAMYHGQAPTSVAYGQQPQPVQPKGNRKGLLIGGGAVLGVLLLVGGFFLGNWWGSTPVDDAMLPSLSYGDGGDIPALNESSSDYCLNTPLVKGRTLTKNNWVECDERHDAEWYEAAVVVGASNDSDAVAASYPGQDRARQFGESKCLASFYSNKIDAGKRPQLKFLALYPTEKEWAKPPATASGDQIRKVICLVVDKAGGQRTDQAVKPVK